MKQTFSTRVKRGALVCFIAYVVLLVYFLLFAERGYTTDGFNVTPFDEISRYITYRESLGFKLVALNLGGNILGFSPLGFMLPIVNSRFNRMISTVLFCFLFSMTIEVIQLIAHVGCFDVDDMILNTIGGIVGYILYVLMTCVRRTKDATTNEKEKKG